MTPLASDSAEWSRVLDADERALGDLFARHHHRVFRHALRLVALPAEADDVMAATFFELWNRRLSVHLVDGSVLPWLLATTTNLARNRLRGMIRYQRVIDRLPRDELADAAEQATDRLEQLEQRRRMRQALRQVSAVDAALITLTVLDGFTTAEAGAAVGLAPGAARMRLSRARGRLRVLLGGPDGPAPRLIEEPAS